MTMDAAMALFFLTAIFYFTLTSALLIRSETLLHTMTTHTAKEMGQYSQLAKLGAENGVEDVVDFVLSIDDTALHDGVKGVQQKALDAVVEETDDDENDFSIDALKNKRLLVQSLAKEIFKQYIPGQTDMQKNIYLKRLGVLGGLDGLFFSHTKIVKKYKKWYVHVAVTCRLRGLYFQFLEYYHFIRHKIIVKVW